MKRKSIFLFLCLSIYFSACAQNIPNPEEQIAAAVLAAPEDTQVDAKVWGYNAQGELVVLREGSNNMICLADDPNKEGFGVACYHVDLEEFMARGRALKADGKNPMEVFDIREKEAKAGNLNMPKQPTTLHLLEGPEGAFDAEAGEAPTADYRSVVYIPWATAESTGLPTSPMTAGGPWIMDPGTHRAHIMITPPPKN